MHAQLLNSKIGATPPGDPGDVLPAESDRNRELFPSPMPRFFLAKQQERPTRSRLDSWRPTGHEVDIRSFYLPQRRPCPFPGRCWRRLGNPHKKRGSQLDPKKHVRICPFLPAKSLRESCSDPRRSPVNKTPDRVRSYVQEAERAESERTTTYIWWQTPGLFPDTL